MQINRKERYDFLLSFFVFVCQANNNKNNAILNRVCVSTGQILISVNSLAGRTYAKHVEIVFILKLLLGRNIHKNVFKIGVSVCVC